MSAPSVAGTGYESSFRPVTADDNTLAVALRIGRLSEIAARANADTLRRNSLRSGTRGQASQSARASRLIGSGDFICIYLFAYTYMTLLSLMLLRYRQDDATRICLLYTSPSPRDRTRSRMPSS